MSRRIVTAAALLILLAVLWPGQALAQTPPAVVVEYYHLDALALRHAAGTADAAQGDPERARQHESNGSGQCASSPTRTSK
jgi:hypothetical protein